MLSSRARLWTAGEQHIPANIERCNVPTSSPQSQTLPRAAASVHQPDRGGWWSRRGPISCPCCKPPNSPHQLNSQGEKWFLSLFLSLTPPKKATCTTSPLEGSAGSEIIGALILCNNPTIALPPSPPHLSGPRSQGFTYISRAMKGAGNVLRNHHHYRVHSLAQTSSRSR